MANLLALDDGWGAMGGVRAHRVCERAHGYALASCGTTCRVGRLTPAGDLPRCRRCVDPRLRAPAAGTATSTSPAPPLKQ